MDFDSDDDDEEEEEYASAISDFRREVQVLKTLRHPNIVLLLAYSTIPNHEVALYELLWNPDEATGMLPTIGWDDRAASELLLTFRDTSLSLDDQRKSVTMGRAEDNDLVVKGNLISRIHAKIEMRKGKFMLIDQSTNGTFLQNVQGEERFVRRDTTELRGEGVIGLGRAEQPGGSLAIHFKTAE